MILGALKARSRMIVDGGNGAAVVGRYLSSVANALPPVGSFFVLPQAQAGLFAVVFAVASITGNLGLAWARAGAIRFGMFPHSASLRPIVASPGRWLTILSCVLAGLVLSVLADGDAWAPIVLGGSALSLGVGVTGVASALALRHALNSRLLGSEVLRCVLGTGSLMLAARSGSGQVLVVLVAVSFLAPWYWLFPLVRVASNSGTNQESNASRIISASWLRYGWPAGVLVGLDTATQYLDRILIGVFGGNAAAARYANAYDLVVRVPSMVVAPLLLILSIRSNQYFDGGDVDRSRRLDQLMARTGCLIAIGWPLVILLCGDVIASIVGNPSFADRGNGFWFLGVSAGIATLRLAVNRVPELHQRIGPLIAAALCSFVVNAGSNVVLIPRFGASAAVVVNVSSGVVYLLGAWWYRKNLLASVADRAPLESGGVL